MRILTLSSLAVLCGLQIAAAAPMLLWNATLSGATEVPATGSTATGLATVSLTGDLLSASVTFNGLIGGPAAAAHIHCCTAPGTNTGIAIPFTGFPSLVSGTYSNVFDLTTTAVYNSSFLTAHGGTAASAEAALVTGIQGGQAYVNIHDQQFPGGEIRGFLTPEPASIALVGLGIGVVLLRRRLSNQRVVVL